MTLTLKDLTKDIRKIDTDDVLSCWRWLLPDTKKIVTISCLGDLFVARKDNSIYWLQADCGDLTKVADNLEEYQKLLTDEDKLDNWFLPLLIEKLLDAGKILKENEVYSYLKIPVLGGEYSVDNIVPTDISVHFAFFGQVCEQIKDLPDGTEIKIKFDNK